MIRSILSVPEEKLAKIGASTQLSPYERKLLKELCYILKPFEDATLMVQKYKSVSANLVIPIFMGLRHQLNELSIITYNNKMVKTLKLSLDKRLGISMSDDNFLLAAMLDPTIKLKWCNTSETIEMEEKCFLMLKNITHHQYKRNHVILMIPLHKGSREQTLKIVEFLVS